MTFNDQLKFNLATYHSIFTNRASVLNHLFCTINGYEWVDGELVSDEGTETLNQLAQIEQFVAEGKHKQLFDDSENIPAELLGEFFDFIVPANIEELLVDTKHNHWYPMSPGYNKLENVPANAKPDWINAAWECANLVLTNGIDLSREIKNVLYHFKGDVAKATKSVTRQHEQNKKIARQSIERMVKMFPDHKFENNPAPTFDVKRKGVKGVQSWPLDGTPVIRFDKVLDPFKKALRFAYTMRRKNQKKSIPYQGLGTLGRSEGGSYGGRDALEVILSVMAQVCIEQGQRIALSKLRPRLDSHLRHAEWKREDEARQASDPRYKLRCEISKRVDDRAEPFIDESDPLQVELLAEVFESRKRLAFLARVQL